MRIGLIGAGNMAGALARGWGEPLTVSDPIAERAEALAAEVSGRAVATNAEVADECDLVVLCHKPAQLAEVAADLGGRARAVVSILAGTPVAAVEDAYPGVPVYRVLPSIPAEVREGVFCYAPGKLADAGPEAELLELLGRLGSVVRLDEPLIEPAMALMSSGPAFLALVVEALAEAGVRQGLPQAEATRLTVETMAGTAAYLRARDLDAAGLRERVTSPGGVTERGLAALEHGGLRAALGGAVDAVVEAAR